MEFVDLNKYNHTLFFTLFLIILISTLFLQADLAHQRYIRYEKIPECPWCETNPGQYEDIVFIPVNASVMRFFSPADPHFLADILWMKTAYYFGQHVMTNRQYPYMFHLLDLITDLSPEWIQPYLFAAVIFPTELENAEDGLYFIDKGLVYHQENWQLWFFKGYYLWKYLEDLPAAAQAIYQASLLPDSPPYLIRLSATLATRAGQKEMAFRFLEEALNNISNTIQKRIITEKLQEMMKHD